MRILSFILAAIAVPAAAQVSVGDGRVRSGGVVVDGAGVHTPTATVDATGVHGTRGGGIVVRTNGNTRAVTCTGGALTVLGNGNTLDVSGCRQVEVDGNGNTVTARFTGDGNVSVMGNRNMVTWSAARDVRVGVSNLGSHNMLARR